MKLVIRKCSWCGWWMGFKFFFFKMPVGTETSGICPKCLAKQIAECKERLQARRNQKKALNRLQRGIRLLLFPN